MKRYHSDSYFPVYRRQHDTVQSVIRFWQFWRGVYYG